MRNRTKSSRRGGSSASLIVAAAVLLAGCGGGGGDEPAAPPVPPVAQPPNSAPVIAGDPVVLVRSGEPYAFTPSATDTDADRLTFSVRNAPPWASLDPVTGRLSGTPLDQHIGSWPDIGISVSDGRVQTDLAPFSIDVLAQVATRAAVLPDPQATVVERPDGFSVTGSASIATGGRSVAYRDASLDFTFDPAGNLLRMSGQSLLPPEIASYLRIDGNVRADVQYLSGEEINASREFGPDSPLGIRVQDDSAYTVYRFSQSVGASFEPEGRAAVRLDIGDLASQQHLIIADETDPMVYQAYGVRTIAGPPSGAAGFGVSRNTRLPFVPRFGPSSVYPFEEARPFNGNTVLKGNIVFGAGKLPIDLLEIDGVGVCRAPRLLVRACDPFAEDPLVALGEAAAGLGSLPQGVDRRLALGLNGRGKVNFSVLNQQLWEFPFASLTAVADVTSQRQRFAMQGVIDGGGLRQPSWIPIRPDVVPDALVLGRMSFETDLAGLSGDFELELRGQLVSELPRATLEGELQLSPDGLTIRAGIPDTDNPVTVTASANEERFEAVLGYGFDFVNNVDEVVLAGLDRQLGRLQTALAEIEQANSDYEFELSLGGLRTLVPQITADARAILDAVPGSVRNAVRNAFVDYVNDYRTCFLGLCTNPLDPLVNEDAVGLELGTGAQGATILALRSTRDALDALDEAIASGDSATARTALRAALLAVWNRRQWSHRVVVDYDFPLGLGTLTFFDRTYSRTVIPTATADRIKAAADNVFRITETSDRVVRLQSVFDELPTEQVISDTRRTVEQGVAQIPSFRGAGYRITRDLVYTPFVLIGDREVGVSFNLLSPVDALRGVGDTLAALLTGGD